MNVEDIDRDRVEEAMRRATDSYDIAIFAAALARVDWKPVDHLMMEARDLAVRWIESGFADRDRLQMTEIVQGTRDQDLFVRMAYEALRRGFELGGSGK